MSKRLAQVLTFAGAIVFVAGLILTIVLIADTGQVVDDSECDSSMGPVVTSDIELAACVTSDDPKVLIGVAVLLLGGTMVGLGIWQWVVAAQREPGSGGGGLMGSIQNLQDKAMQLQQQSMESGMSVGTTPPAPPPASPDPPAPDTT